MNKPTLKLFEELKEIKTAKHNLLDVFGYVSIYDAKKQMGMKSADEVYSKLFKNFNKNVKTVNAKSKKDYAVAIKKWLADEHHKNIAQAVKNREQKRDKKIQKQQQKQKKDVVKEFLLKNQVPKVLNETEYELFGITKYYNSLGDGEETTGLRNSLKKHIGKNVVVVYMVNGEIIKDVKYSVPLNFSSWWNEIRKEWTFGGGSSGGEIFTKYELIDGETGNNNSIWDGGDIDLNKCLLFVYEETPIITSAKIIQAFQEGITNCLLTPIKKWSTSMLEESKSKSAKSRYTCINRELEKFEVLYKDGVPENAIAEICNKLQIDISVQMPCSETKFIDCHSIKKRLKYFNFLNTRINHIEYEDVCGDDHKFIKQVRKHTNINEISNLGEYTESSNKEIRQIIRDCESSGSFCYFNKQKTCAYTLNKVYKVVDAYNEIVNKFELYYEMNEMMIDDITQPELSSFIHEGTHYNSTVDFVSRSKLVKSTSHYDMSKAYANFEKCAFYNGFLGKITDFRQCNKIESIGLYKICNLDFTKANGKFVAYNKTMKIYNNNCVYPSPELDMLLSYGVTFEVVAGCWGVETLDFEFDDDMLNTKTEDNISYYAKWCGQIDSHKLHKDFWFKGDWNLACILRDNFGDGILKSYQNDEICLSYPKKHNYHKGHITAFITAYQRISVIEQLIEIDINNVTRVCVDGIYCNDNNVVCKNVFRPKPDRHFDNIAGSSYISNNIGNRINNFASVREHNSKELWIGAGGNGKTHTNLIDKGLIKVLFASPSWKLARNKQKDYMCKVNVWANIVTTDPEKISLVKRYNVLVVDEVSMMNELDKQYILKTYSNMKLIFCGDLGYQLPCVVGQSMNDTGFDKIIKLDVNYRCIDSRLLEILDKLRTMIDTSVNKYDINNYVISKFIKLGRHISINALQQEYEIEDMILTGTNVLKEEFTDLFGGKFSKEKYYVMANNRLFSNGEIVIGDKPDIKCEPRHAFTVHSIQGETAYNKLYIDSRRMFDSRMFYTALSRAKTLDQIFIIV